VRTRRKYENQNPITKSERREAKRNGKRNAQNLTVVPILGYEQEIEPIQALNEAQQEYINSIKENIITFGIGPAGTGKSYVAACSAYDMYKSKKIKRIIVSRPVVEMGEKLGFLPGELEDKFAPYLEPIKAILYDRIGKGETDYMIKNKKIVAMPLAYIRGMSLKESFVMLDEAQNCSVVQIKTFLTRIGNDCKVVIDGDLDQKDIAGQSGLGWAIDKLKDVKKINTVEFEIDDIVRSGICRDIVRAFSK
jgi:phosphate starvation-inducible PhoH-like protein